MKCYHKKYRSATRDVIFRLQFHTGAVQGYRLVFAKEDLDNASKGEVPPRVQTECRENGPLVGGPREPHVFLSLFSTMPPATPQTSLLTKLLPVSQKTDDCSNKENINNLRYADDTTLMAESEEQLRRLNETERRVKKLA